MRLLRSGMPRPSGVLALFACLALFAAPGRAMICYRCTVLPPQYIGDADQPCAKFDGSSRFEVDCPTSTFCVKRIIHYRLPNGTMVTTAERNCAPQRSVVQDYNYNDEKWQSKETVDTNIYQEGCFKGENRGTPNGPSEYCYCSADYCNASPSMAKPLKIVSLLVAAVLFRLS